MKTWCEKKSLYLLSAILMPSGLSSGYQMQVKISQDEESKALLTLPQGVCGVMFDMLLNCPGVLFLTLGREALVDRVSSSPRTFWEFLADSLSEKLPNKSCHQYKDTLLFFTPFPTPFLPVLSPVLCECKLSSLHHHLLGSVMTPASSQSAS